MSFEEMWADLAPVGRSASSGGYFRQPWTSAETELREWFRAAASDRGLEIEQDGLGNLLAWWRPDGASGPAVLTGSHLDSVLDGGAYDGPLGVVSALAAVDLMHERGVVPTRPLAVGVFVEEEGSRFGLACLGSRLAPASSRGRRCASCATATGSSWATWSTAATPSPLLDRFGCFVELHVEQGRDLVDRGARSGSRAGSGRTGATASTSPARPTMPGRRGWRTAATRCSATR